MTAILWPRPHPSDAAPANLRFPFTAHPRPGIRSRTEDAEGTEKQGVRGSVGFVRAGLGLGPQCPMRVLSAVPKPVWNHEGHEVHEWGLGTRFAPPPHVHTWVPRCWTAGQCWARCRSHETAPVANGVDDRKRSPFCQPVALTPDPGSHFAWDVDANHSNGLRIRQLASVSCCGNTSSSSRHRGSGHESPCPGAGTKYV